MRAVLGIDAAWTVRQPSGVALAIELDDRWILAALAPSYADFVAPTDPARPAGTRSSGAAPDAPLLLQAAHAVCGRAVDLVAIDMPLAHSAITGRREADDAVSRAYGARKCGTHSPSAVRPGAISDELRGGFARSGYGLCTEAVVAPGLIEVYPHPALVELAGAAERLPYKVSRTRSYWPQAAPAERHRKLLDQWRAIILMLEQEIEGVSAALPPPGLSSSGRDLKAYEDRIDAVVCAWTAIAALEGRAIPYGDADAAIWIPASGFSARPAVRHG